MHELLTLKAPFYPFGYHRFDKTHAAKGLELFLFPLGGPATAMNGFCQPGLTSSSIVGWISSGRIHNEYPIGCFSITSLGAPIHSAMAKLVFFERSARSMPLITSRVTEAKSSVELPKWWRSNSRFAGNGLYGKADNPYFIQQSLGDDEYSRAKFVW